MKEKDAIFYERLSVHYSCLANFYRCLVISIKNNDKDDIKMYKRLINQYNKDFNNFMEENNYEVYEK